MPRLPFITITASDFSDFNDYEDLVDALDLSGVDNVRAKMQDGIMEIHVSKVVVY